MSEETERARTNNDAAAADALRAKHEETMRQQREGR